MLPMIFKFLSGPIINKVVSTGVRYFEKRQEISEAKHTARLEIEAKKATADIDWDAAAMEASKGSWKDELWTIWIIGVLTALLIPQSQPHVINALTAMGEAPDWFSILVLTSAAASFGVRDVIKNRLARKR